MLAVLGLVVLLLIGSEAHAIYQLRRCGAVHRHRAAAMLSREDAESNERLVEALFSSVEEASTKLAKDPLVASHLQLDVDENGEPTQLRFVYVDEVACIGCTYCAEVARNTFYMHPQAVRARAFAQGQDAPELVMEAIDCCPVYAGPPPSQHAAASARVPRARKAFFS